MLVGNKLDMEGSRKTPRELGETFAQEEGLLFMEASAKSGDGVEELFMEIGTYHPSPLSAFPFPHLHTNMSSSSYGHWTASKSKSNPRTTVVVVGLILWIGADIGSEEITTGTPSTGQDGGKQSQSLEPVRSDTIRL